MSHDSEMLLVVEYFINDNCTAGEQIHSPMNSLTVFPPFIIDSHSVTVKGTWYVDLYSALDDKYLILKALRCGSHSLTCKQHHASL